MLVAAIRYNIRDLVYPGLDLHTRNRPSLCRVWQTRPRDVLDAGSGKGYFSRLATLNPRTPFSLCVRALKPTGGP